MRMCRSRRLQQRGLAIQRDRRVRSRSISRDRREADRCKGRRGAAIADRCFLAERRPVDAEITSPARAAPRSAAASRQRSCRSSSLRHVSLAAQISSAVSAFASTLASACWPRGRRLTRPSRGVELRRQCAREFGNVGASKAIVRRRRVRHLLAEAAAPSRHVG